MSVLKNMVASKEYRSRNFMLPLPGSMMGKLTDVWFASTSLSRSLSRHRERSSTLTLSNSLPLVAKKKMYLFGSVVRGEVLRLCLSPTAA